MIKKQLEEADWKGQQKAHQKRFERLLKGYLDQRGRQGKEPILDFLFEYYRLRAGTLMTWSPGIGVLLKGKSADLFLKQTGFRKFEDGVMLDPSLFPQRRISSIRWIRELLFTTAQKAPFLGCYGIHEWAMVYKSEQYRHQQIPIRPSIEEVNAFVESKPIPCSHIDAFRHFTPAAAPLIQHELTRENQIQMEQPGCLHANMDLYKWGYKLKPWLDSKILADAFELAYMARKIDVCASPYDMSAQGLQPIKVETEAGRSEYKKYQLEIWEKAKIVRAALIEGYDKLLTCFDSEEAV